VENFRLNQEMTLNRFLISRENLSAVCSNLSHEKISGWQERRVLPGMTGLWQVEARQDPSFDSYISLDTAYVENWSLWLDMKILARTVGVVFSGTGS